MIPYARNPRHNEAAVAKVAASLREFGWRQPIVVDSSYKVIVGHTRLAAARQLGMHAVPVHVAEGLTVSQARAYRLADNRVHEEARWNEELLALEFSDLREAGIDMSLTGFDASELARLLNADEPDTEPKLSELSYSVVVACSGEREQGALIERLEKEGYSCRPLMS